MNQNYQNNINRTNNMYPYYNQTYRNNDERLAGGFVFPFLLGGVTGAALAPSFWNNNNYNRPVYYYSPYPYYYPYPRRWF